VGREVDIGHSQTSSAFTFNKFKLLCTGPDNLKNAT